MKIHANQIIFLAFSFLIEGILIVTLACLLRLARTQHKAFESRERVPASQESELNQLQVFDKGELKILIDLVTNQSQRACVD